MCYINYVYVYLNETTLCFKFLRFLFYQFLQIKMRNLRGERMEPTPWAWDKKRARHWKEECDKNGGKDDCRPISWFISNLQCDAK